MKKKNLIKAKYELSLFFIFFLQFIIKLPSPEHVSNIGNTRLTLYTLTYDVGIGHRMLMGTIISLFSAKITLQIVYILSVVFSLLALALLAKFLTKTIMTSDEKSRNMIYILIAIFLVAATNYTSFFNPQNFTVFDLYVFTLTMIMIRIVRIKYVRFLIPVLCVACVAIHEVYMTTYMLIIGCVLLYELVKSKWNLKNILLTGISYTSIIASFIYLQFFTKPLPFSSSDELISHLKPTTDINFFQGVFDYGYFHDYTLKESFESLENVPHSASLFTLLLVAPIIILFFCIWKNAISFCETKAEKFIYFVFAVSPILIAPSFFIAIDYDRWYAAYNISQFVLIFYLFISKEKPVHLAVEKLYDFYKKHSWVFISLIVYFSALTFLKINAVGYFGEFLKENFVGR